MIITYFGIVVVGSGPDVGLAQIILNNLYNFIGEQHPTTLKKLVCAETQEDFIKRTAPSIAVTIRQVHYIISLIFRETIDNWIVLSPGDHCQFNVSDPDLLDKINQATIGLLTLQPSSQQLIADR